MKLLTAIASLALATASIAQETTGSGVSVELTTGFGGNHSNHGTMKFGADVQYHLGNTYFVGIQSSWGVNGNRTVSNNVTWNGTNSLLFGRMSSVSEHVSIQPYLGLGHQISMATDYKYEVTPPTDMMSKMANKFFSLSNDGTSKQRYGVNRHTAIGIPVGVNFLFHKQTYGLTMGTYLFASRYPEVVLRVGVAFGKLH